jgi:hypothetical protein
MVMAIRRCPYCKAIIDESQKYCNNCGTQLLFPEDESADEDIKGEKIRDDDFRDAEPGEAELERSLEPAEDELLEEEIDLEKILDGSAAFPDESGHDGPVPFELPGPPPPKPVPPKPSLKAAPKSRSKPEFRPVPAERPAPKPAPKPAPTPVPEPEPETETESVIEIESGPMPAGIEFPHPTASRTPAEETDKLPAWATEEPGADAGTEVDEAALEPEEKEPDVVEGEIEAEIEAELDGRPEPENEGEDAKEDETEDEEEDNDEEAEENLKKEAEENLGDEIEASDEDAEPVREPLPPPSEKEALPSEADEPGEPAEEEADSAIPSRMRADLYSDELDISEAYEIREDEELDEGDEPDEDAAPADEDEDKDDRNTREEIARLIAALEKKQKKEPLSKDERKRISPVEGTGGLPAWADTPRTSAAVEPEDEEPADKEAGDGGFVPGDTMDFEEEVMREAALKATTKPTIGIPETVTRTVPSAPATEAAEEEPVPDFVFQKKLGFLSVVRAGIYDLFFVALIWFVAAWVASRLLAVPLDILLRRAAVPFALLFGVLFVGYLFLFLFFLGETLGRRLAVPKK